MALDCYVLPASCKNGAHAPNGILSSGDEPSSAGEVWRGREEHCGIVWRISAHRASRRAVRSSLGPRSRSVRWRYCCELGTKLRESFVQLFEFFYGHFYFFDCLKGATYFACASFDVSKADGAQQRTTIPRLYLPLSINLALFEKKIRQLLTTDSQ